MLDAGATERGHERGVQAGGRVHERGRAGPFARLADQPPVRAARVEQRAPRLFSRSAGKDLR